ncbi:LysM repeat protein [Mucilaginibacter frigoritolerans]|uniref:LysM repeat protein n=1 Tax=Mucilaginibacter frigoritolerans TaxID=652788 RepID=A0A562TYA2_9SPHI|nr:LysM peptidoglycan-binding domain-containing protein [Mucilaginibacter frigoritolerans]TWI98074.1 LysM repeat protein [Mucilaginibacter frigoritolerans]
MKFKILLAALLLFLVSLSGFAKPVIDSVGVKNNDGKKMIQFKVKPKDTYYSIGRRYNVKPEVLMKFNGSKKAILTIGSVINIPTDQPYKKTTKEIAQKETAKEKKTRLAKEAEEARAEKKHQQKEVVADQPAEQAPERLQQPVTQPVVQQPVQDNTPPTEYKVSAGETLYSISKRFNSTVDAITKLNNLSSTTLIPGQILLVPAGVASATSTTTNNTPPVVPPVVSVENHTAQNDSPAVASNNKDSSNSAEHHLNTNRYGLYEKNEKGVATWIDDASLDPNKKFVLHRTAPIGTVIKITNPMTNRTTFAKVVGSFTDSESTKDVIIVMTKSVADSLGALDKRFRVDISYGSPNE